MTIFLIVFKGPKKGVFVTRSKSDSQKVIQMLANPYISKVTKAFQFFFKKRKKRVDLNHRLCYTFVKRLSQLF